MKITWLAALMLVALIPNNAAAQTPPVAKVVPAQLETHGHVRVDNYYWLNQREDPEVISYLEAENGYTETMTAHIEGMSASIFEEMKGRIKQDDDSVPYQKNGYWYYTRYETGKEYPIYARRKGSMEAAEQIMVDVNALADEAGSTFFQVANVSVSPNAQLAAVAVDTLGRRKYTIRFKNLETGEWLPDTIDEVTANLTWANDNATIFYVNKDPQTLRPYQVFRRTLGDTTGDDALIFQEDDEEFYTYIYRSKSDAYIIIGTAQTLSTEFSYIDANDPMSAPQVVNAREENHEYSVDHYGDHFYILTNMDGATNFKLMKTPISSPERANWEEVVPHRADVLLSSFELFKDYLVLVERSDALVHMRVRPWDGTEEHLIDFGEPAYYAGPSTNVEFDTNLLRFTYTSLTTPNSTFDYDMGTRTKTLLKETEVLGGFNKADYVTERDWAIARDGERVPLSIVYHKDTPIDGSAPLLQYAYGSYGSSMSARFSSTLLSLLDRGFVYAIAHIRGGQEMGRQWYEDGKLLKKKNTFTDFVDATRHLTNAGYGDANRIFARGGSAGGLLMGAVVNMNPELYRGVIAAVPFVDVVTTMLDDTIPLTTFEYDEWGNPNDKAYYDYMLSYSPYDNVEAKEYPNMLVTTGLHDSQVQYWEPAKWVAKLRTMKTDNNVLLLKTNMDAGHGGASGRFQRLEELAFEYSFVLDLAGASEVLAPTN